MQNILYQANTDIILYYSDNLQAVRTSSVSDFMFGKQDSAGLYPVQNDLINWDLAKPVAAAAGGSSTGLVIGIPIAAIVIIGLGALVVVRRRASAGDRE
jgi:peptide/nickel transport system substrate-binding protein